MKLTLLVAIRFVDITRTYYANERRHFTNGRGSMGEALRCIPSLK